MTSVEPTKKTPNRIVVRRTAALEAQLQELWKLNPEIRNKPSATIALSVGALIRESKFMGRGVSLIAAASPSLSTSVGTNSDSEWN